MSNVRLAWWLFLLAIIFSGEATAQANPSGIRLSFVRQNNFTYSSQLSINHQLTLGKYRFNGSIQHNNLLNTSRADNPFVLAYLGSQIWQHYDFSKVFGAVSWFESDQFLTTQNQRYSIYVGARFSPFPYLTAEAMGGYSWDYRGGILDEGFSPALRIRAQHIWKDGLRMRNLLFVRTKYILPRHQRNIIISSDWEKQFGQFAQLTTGVQLGSNEMDDYLSESVEKIKSDTLSTRLGISYQVMPGLIWTTQNEVHLTRRRFDYVEQGLPAPEFNNLSYQQVDVNTTQQLQYQSKKLSGQLTYQYSYTGRRYELENSIRLPSLEFGRLRNRERQKDFLRNLYLIEAELSWKPWRKQTLNLAIFNRYQQYDSPSEDNFDDNDELSYGVSLGWRTQWNQRFQTGYKVLGNVRRYAFLFEERSQDNYTQYALRAEFDYLWQVSDRLTIRGDQFLYVTYNIKDFQDLNRTDRATRNLESRLEADWRASRKWLHTASIYRKETHLSYINWERFTETTLDTSYIYIIEQKNRYHLPLKFKSTQFFAEVGYKHFSQTRRQNTSMIDAENVLQPINLRIRTIQTGPLTALIMRRKGVQLLNLGLWWQYQLQDFQFSRTEKLTTLTATFRESALQEVATAFRPFIQLKANIVL
ncbi:MAG: hypothetical protein AAGI38_02360 [Bacteroidota bacterium]